MSRLDIRAARNLEKNPINAIDDIKNKYLSDLYDMFGGINDPRDKRYITYSSKAMLGNLAVLSNDKPDLAAKKRLMQKQIKWCRNHIDTIENRANKVYDMVVNHPDKNHNLVKRSSKFDKLETLLDKLLKKD